MGDVAGTSAPGLVGFVVMAMVPVTGLNPALPLLNGRGRPCGLADRVTGTGASEDAPHGPPKTSHAADVKKPRKRRFVRLLHSGC